MTCPSCGNDNRAGARFCDGCGSPLVAARPAGPEPRPEEIPDGIQAPPADAPAEVGTGRFETVGFLGEGSRKRVLLCRDRKRTGSLVAVSVFNTEGLGAAAQARARREAEAVQRLGEHPHLVRVLASGQDGQRPWIASEFMPGGDLADLLDDAPGRRLPVEQAVGIASDIAAALAHAHGRGIVHRDIKPANVWLDARGTARLGDFGLAASTARTREAVERMVVGTAAYLPPEQAIGRRTDGRADLYSLGAILYEMLAGEPPFPGDDPVSIISRHLSAEPLPPSRHNPDVPASLDALVLRLLAKSPEERPGGAAGLGPELAQTLAAAEEEQAEGPNRLEALAGGAFVGRDRELAALKELLEAAIAGHGTAGLVEGEPGIGKTRLLEELITYARLRGAGVLKAACHEAHGLPAYWPIAQAVRGYVREADPVGLAWQLGSDGPEVARLVPELPEIVASIERPSPIEGEEGRFRFYEAVASFLAGIAGSRPLLFAIDDLHWADSASLDLLRYLAGRLAGTGVLLVCAYREEEATARAPVRRALAELDEVPRRAHLSLAGLDRDAIARFVELTTGELPDAPMLAAIHEQTGGNPFFVGEIVRLAGSGGGLASRDPAAVPGGVRDAVLRRVERLEGSVRETLEAAAVVGREFETAVLARLAHGDFDADLELARAARIVESRDGRERHIFSHAVFREVLLSELGAERRRELHEAAGLAIEQLHGERLDSHLASLANHFTAAGPEGGGRRALRYSLAAARQAAAGLAHADAAEHLERALEVLPDDWEGDPTALRLELADEMTRSGRFHDARAVLLDSVQAARQGSDESAMVRIVTALAALSEAGNADTELLAHAAEALELLGPGGDPGDRALLLAALAQEHFWVDAEGLASREAEQALDLARASGRDDALAGALVINQTLAASREGGNDAREVMVRELLEVARRCGDRTNEMRALANLVSCRLVAADTDGADRALADFERLARRLSEPRHLWHVPIMRATRATMRGELAEARRLSAEGARLGGLAEEPLSAQFHVLQRSIIHTFEGGVEEMLPQIRRMVEAYPAIPAWRLALVAFLLEAERPEEAREEFEPIVAAGLERIPRDLNWIAGVSRIAEVAAALGEVEACRQLLGMLEGFSGEVIVVGRAAALNGPVDHFLGLLCSAVGDADRAVGYLRRAIATAERMGERPIRAGSWLSLGRALLQRGASGDRDAALEAFSEALAIGQPIGMRRLVERAVRERLEAQGVAGVAATASIDSVVSAVAKERPDLGSMAASDGRVTILFSDIEDSTLMNERLGDERWLELLRRHNGVFRRRVAEHGGLEVKSQGDGFMLAFPDPAAALRCALAVQEEISSQDVGAGERIRVRMGLHVGEVIEEEGDFFGRTVVLAARIAAQARGGEVLVSEQLRAAAAAGDGPVEWDGGRELELKGLAGAHVVFRAERLPSFAAGSREAAGLAGVAAPGPA